MRTDEWVILTVIILGGWMAFWAGSYPMCINCFLAAAIIYIIKTQKYNS